MCIRDSVFDPLGQLRDRLNHDLVVAQAPSSARLDEIRVLVERHARYTGSARAIRLLGAWEAEASRFVHVAPRVEATTFEADDELVAEGAA